MTAPTVFPTKWAGTSLDYLNAKVDRSGAVRGQYTTVTVPATSSAATIIGLVPFQRGYRFLQGATQLYTADLDTATNVTIDIGYVYKTGSTETDDPDAFASALATPQTGGLITFDEFAGLSWVAADDGWIAVTLAAGPTTTAGAIQGQVVGEYDNSIGTNAAN